VQAQNCVQSVGRVDKKLSYRRERARQLRMST